MKKILTALTISFSAMSVSSIALAAPHGFEDRGYGSHEQQRNNFRSQGPNHRGDGFNRNDDREERAQDRRKDREVRGFQRLQQHKWQTGYVMPQHYRGNSYKADFKTNNLPRPDRKQQWYKINNDFILVDSDSNSIVKIREN